MCKSEALLKYFSVITVLALFKLTGSTVLKIIKTDICRQRKELHK